jgi:hypothetical protein
MSTDAFAVLRQPAGAAATVAYTGTAGSITAPCVGTSVMVWCTTDAYVNSGAAATTANGTPIPAFTPIWLPIAESLIGGSGIIVSAIQISAGGTLYAKQFA